MIIDPEKVANVIAEIAEEEIAARFGKLSKSDIDTKSGPNDFVTQADIEAERQLRRVLSDFYPAATFIGEEVAQSDPSLVTGLESSNGAFWVVDPLDGTRNFVQGRDEFGTIVALVVNGEIRNGWIYAIPEKAFAISEKGEGVTWRDERLRSLAPLDGDPEGYRAIGNMAEPWKTQLIPKMKEALKTEPAHCSAYAYLNLVRGLRDFALYSRVHPWDHAAGVSMLWEIGGRAEYLDDRSKYNAHATQGRPLLVSGSQDRWQNVDQALTAGSTPS